LLSHHVSPKLGQLALGVISGASVLLSDDFVGGLDLVELIRSDLFLRGILDLVGVEFKNEFAIGCLDDGSRGVPWETEGQVRIGW
jgi:hypothetical protein